MHNNIFEGRIGDSAAYFAFYVVIPILITIVSLNARSTELIADVYCFVTILVSVFNGIYDAGNRWHGNEKSRRNLKLALIMLFNSVVAIYCLYVIFLALIAHDISLRCDLILLSYSGTCIIAVWDLGKSFLNGIALKNDNGGKNNDS